MHNHGCGSCSATAANGSSTSATRRTTSTSPPTRSGRPTEVRFGTQSTTVPPTLYEEDVATGARTLLQAGSDTERRPRPLPLRTAVGAPRPTACWCRSTSCITSTPHSTAPPPASSTATARTRHRCHRGSRSAGCRCSIEASCGRWCTRGAAANSVAQWYLDGKLEAKANTFTDTIACAEHLIDTGVVAAGRLCIRGGSAGGLLVGACITMRPDLFASAVAEVPFVDIVSTMSDPTLPLTVTEWEEWGDPRVEPFASVMSAYSPYDNTVAAVVSRHLLDRRAERSACQRARAGEVDGAPAIRQHRRRADPAAHRDGRRARRTDRQRYDAWRDEARTLAFILATT